MTAAEYVEARGLGHAPEEPSVRGGPVTWRRIHTSAYGRLEYWTYLGYCDQGRLYRASLDVRDVTDKMTTLADSFYGVLSYELYRLGSEVTDCKSLHPWLGTDEEVTLPSGRYRAYWKGARWILDRYNGTELVESHGT